MFKIGNSKDLPAIPSHLSDEGKDFIMQCLQREPSKRPTASALLQHPFVRNAAPLENSVLSFDPLERPISISIGLKSKAVGHARNLSSLDMQGLLNQQLRGSKFTTSMSDIHMRNISCPVSPIGSPHPNSRSSQHINGRMSPSPISSPRTTSGSCTPLTGGSGALPFTQPKHLPYRQEGFAYAGRPTYNDPKMNFFPRDAAKFAGP